MRIIAKAWEEFRLRVLGPDASPDEVEERQTAFYAGWNGLMREVRGNTHMRNEDFLDRIKSIETELDEYGRVLLLRQHEATMDLAAGATVGASGKAN